MSVTITYFLLLAPLNSEFSFVALVLQLRLTARATGSKPAFELRSLPLKSHLPCLMCSSSELSLLYGLSDTLGHTCSKCKPRIIRITVLTLHNVNLILNLGQAGDSFFILVSFLFVFPIGQIT